MTQFRDLSIHRKLLAMTLLVSGTVLTVALSVLFTYQVLSFHSSFKRDTATLAEIIANNSTAALAFDDRKAAGEILASLKAKPTVRGACLTDRQGAVIASAGHLDFEAPNMFPSDKEFLVRNGMLQYTQPVILEGRVLGRLYLENEYRSALLDLLRFYGLLILMVAAASGLLASPRQRQWARRMITRCGRRFRTGVMSWGCWPWRSTTCLAGSRTRTPR
jgi:hypothetical protein